MRLTAQKDSPAYKEWEHFNSHYRRTSGQGGFALVSDLVTLYIYTNAYNSISTWFKLYVPILLSEKKEKEPITEEEIRKFGEMYSLSSVYAFAISNLRETVGGWWSEWSERFVKKGKEGEEDINFLLKNPEFGENKLKGAEFYERGNAVSLCNGKCISSLYWFSILYWQWMKGLWRARNHKKLVRMAETTEKIVAERDYLASNVLKEVYGDYGKRPESILEKLSEMLASFYTGKDAEVPDFLKKGKKGYCLNIETEGKIGFGQE